MFGLRRIVGIVIVTFAVFSVAGCQGSLGGLHPVCPGKPTVQAALEPLQQHVALAEPMRIHGQCLLGFVDEKGKRREYNLPVNLWIDPPFDFYMQGQAAFGPQGLIFLGSNEREFWLSIKPDINTYWWGYWDEMAANPSMQISPRVVMEALGILDLGEASRWRLENRDGHDILSYLGPDDSINKRVFVNPCNNEVQKIEYFDVYGEARVVVDLGEYEVFVPGFSVPRLIQIANYEGGELTDWIKLTIQSVRQEDFSEKLRERLFTRHKERLNTYDRVLRVTANGVIREH